jgi:hypothetical protein
VATLEPKENDAKERKTSKHDNKSISRDYPVANQSCQNVNPLKLYFW